MLDYVYSMPWSPTRKGRNFLPHLTGLTGHNSFFTLLLCTSTFAVCASLFTSASFPSSAPERFSGAFLFIVFALVAVSPCFSATLLPLPALPSSPRSEKI